MVFGVVAAVAVTILIMVSYVKDLVIDSAYGKMLNMATSYGKLIDKEEENINDGIKQYTGLTTEQFTTILGKMEITGLEEFYYYVVDMSGIIRYHTDESYIGKPNRNLEETVLAGYDGFNQTGMQYRQDADTFKTRMDNISEQIIALNGSIQKVSDAVENVSLTVNATSEGVADIAGKTAEVVNATSDNYVLTNNTIESMNELREIVNRFEYE